MVLAIIRALNLHSVSGHDDVRLIRKGVEIADGKRFHVPFLHVVQCFLHIVDSLRVNSAEVLIDHFLEIVCFLIFKRLPRGVFFCFHRGFVRSGDRNSDRGEERSHCISHVFFHKSFRFDLLRRD